MKREQRSEEQIGRCRFRGNKGGAEVVEDEGVGNELTENKLAEAQR